MKAIGLSKVQITKQFPVSLEGTPIRWYYALDPHVQYNWAEVCAVFIKAIWSQCSAGNIVERSAEHKAEV